MSGAFVLGVLATVLVERFPPTRYVRAFVAVGVLGAYTTFSTLAVETVTLVKDGHAPVGLTYLATSVVVGLMLAYLGFVIARLLPHARVGKDLP